MHGNLTCTVGVLGATSSAGQQALKMLVGRGFKVVAFSRSCKEQVVDGITWVNLTSVEVGRLLEMVGAIPYWISFTKLWALPDCFELLKGMRANRVVCLSSTSLFTKTGSSTAYEEQVVKNLAAGELKVAEWGKGAGVKWTVLRPTMIYGRGEDGNISELLRIIKKLHFFPLFGKSLGLRQPVYVDDVASAAVHAMLSERTENRAYNISGGEQLSYRELVRRVFIAGGFKPRFITINLSVFNFALMFLRLIPRYRSWNADMVLRMNRDMVFDHQLATEDFGFAPQGFVLTNKDVGKTSSPSSP